MKRRYCYSSAVAALSLFASVVIGEWCQSTLGAFYVGLAIWFAALGISRTDKSGTPSKAGRIANDYVLAITFCMNIGVAAPIPFLRTLTDRRYIYVPYWSCLLYGLMISAVGIIVVTIIEIVKNKKEKK